MSDGLAEALACLAARGETVGYGDLARKLRVQGPGSIARLTDALEATMAEDVAAGRPLRAAVCSAKGSAVPAEGFFAAAATLGRDAGTDRTAFVASERAALRQAGPTSDALEAKDGRGHPSLPHSSRGYLGAEEKGTGCGE